MTSTIHVKGNIPLCVRCHKKVFFNEEKRVDGGAWHTICFTCANPRCNRPLNSRNVTIHQNEVYCEFCYPKLFGPCGFGYGIPQALTTEKGWRYSNPTAQWIVPAIPQAYVAPCAHSPENSRTECQIIHSPNCVNSRRILSSNAPESRFECCYENSQETFKCPCRKCCSAKRVMSPKIDYESSPISSSNSNSKERGTAKSRLPKKASKTTFGRGRYKDICSRCGKEVYMAEKLVGAGKAWHKNCFSCRECRKLLDSYTVKERSGELYCSTCCSKIIGPRGYGYGTSPGTLQTHRDLT